MLRPSLVLCIAFSISNAQPISAQYIDPRAIDAAARQLGDSGFSGVVLVARNARVVFDRSYGQANEIAGVRGAYWIGSMTKAFTAAAILRLKEQNKLSLNDPIARFIFNAPADKKNITIRQLLTHTSGIDGSYAGGGHASRDSAVAAILAQPLRAQPGTAYRYMDDDYELLAAIIEIASGKTWEHYVRDQLLAPARLRETRFWPTSDWGHKGANGMAATAGDLLRWSIALRRGRILSAGDAKDLCSGHVYVRREHAEDIFYGYGVRVYISGGRTTEVMHSGSSDQGNTSIMRVLANGFTVIVMSRSGDHGGTTWSSYVAHHIPIQDRPDV